MIRIALIGLHLVVGVSAIGAGQALVLEPDGSRVGLERNWVEGSPFSDYLIPGLFLFVVNGGLNLLSAFALVKQLTWAEAVRLASGVVLMAWISIQTLIIGLQHWSQALWWVVFGVMTVLAAIAFNARRGKTVAELR